jgi:DNA helicase-2/ATP-dependent DNA helicase PcrA
MIRTRELASHIGLLAPTDEQVEVIEAPCGAAVVIAGAGSGKTETMASRVLWLVANGIVPADAVLGLTFTRKAAAELGARIRRQLRSWAQHSDREQRAALLVAEPTVLTYAAYAGRLVADHALRLGLEPSTRLISPAVTWQIADAVVRRYPDDLPNDIGTPPSVTGYVLALAGEMADHLQDPDAVIRFTDDLLDYIDAMPIGPSKSEFPLQLSGLVKALRHRRQLLPLVEHFQQAKLARAAVDFADQMVWAARLAQLPEVRAFERDRYRAVLLDEYQDTGHAQIALLKGLFDGGHLVTAVGDPFQSIYGWRGASAGNIGRFATTFGDGREATFSLSTSWRNDSGVLDAANAVAGPLRRAHPGSTVLAARLDVAHGLVRAAYLDTVESEAEWVADQLKQGWDAAFDPSGSGRTAAVLVRRRSQIPMIDAALRAIGVPVEIVGLGGLLTTPEVIDVVATLHVLADYSSGPALLRVLTGARWRIGPRDLVALSRRAQHLANPGGSAQDRQPGSIVEALDELGDRSHYSPEGFRRMSRLAEQLRWLRRRLSAPLTDLIADVERISGIDIEVAASIERQHVGRVHLDRFSDAAAAFSVDSDEASLGAFLAYLTAAEDEENGLESGEIEVETERVQILTVHGSKGLEWDLVAVPGLVENVFPSPPKNNDWTKSRHLLPFPLRGDAADLPVLDVTGAEHRRELAGWIKASAKTDPPDDHDSKMKARHLLEERRLAYVAFTRARHTLLASGYAWDDTKKARAPSPFLSELAVGAERDVWVVPDPRADNPHAQQLISAAWPADPLGARRAVVAESAELVRAAIAALDGPDLLRTEAGEPMAAPDAAEIASWQHDVDVLLAERSARRPGPIQPVILPARLSVTQLVALKDNPQELARRLHRPMPVRPAPLARRGTAFHTWLEQRWGGDKLLDIDELPGAADESAGPDDDLIALRAAFLASDWAQRTPTEVEVPFDMVFAGVVIRGRMDAVFAEPDDGGWLVVDWKTGALPSVRHADAVAVQLAAYRLAWHRIKDVPLESVKAAFHYIRSDTTVAPADLLDAAGLHRLVLESAQPT